MSNEESSNVDFTKQKQAIELKSPSDNSNQEMDLTNTLQEMRSLIAQFKQQQSSGPIQAGTSCSCNSNDSREKVNKGNLNVNGRDKTKDHNDDNISIHTSGDEIEDNANKREQGSNVSGAGDHGPLSLYSSKVRSDDEEYSSDDDEQVKGRYQDLLDSVQEKMGSPTESEFAEVCGKIWGKAKPKGRSGDEFKNILISSNCSYLKTPYVSSEIYKLHDAATNRDKGAQRKQRAYVKATIPLMQAVVNLKDMSCTEPFSLLNHIVRKLVTSFHGLYGSRWDIMVQHVENVCIYSKHGLRFIGF